MAKREGINEPALVKQLPGKCLITARGIMVTLPATGAAFRKVGKPLKFDKGEVDSWVRSGQGSEYGAREGA